MTETSRIIQPQAEELPSDIVELAAAVAHLPVEHRDGLSRCSPRAGEHESPPSDPGPGARCIVAIAGRHEVPDVRSRSDAPRAQQVRRKVEGA